jgi:hypothetical protein
MKRKATDKLSKEDWLAEGTPADRPEHMQKIVKLVNRTNTQFFILTNRERKQLAKDQC